MPTPNVSSLSRQMMDSPVGRLTLIAREDCLAAVLWENDPPQRVRMLPVLANPPGKVLEQAASQLTEYFDGTRQTFDLPLDLHTDDYGTAFQRTVWRALAQISYGETRSYAQIAQAIGQPQAVRAVGAAIGRNPLSIVVPCHRVIGSNGKMTGFAGGLVAKHHLLRLEARPCPIPSSGI